ncbi:hypothetical protein [Delftia acidovorans]|uniref:hypothetical protein n=1 Tax=Delftia acidovorans TaxID=80866 RepID=UPI002FDE34DA
MDLFPHASQIARNGVFHLSAFSAGREILSSVFTRGASTIGRIIPGGSARVGAAAVFESGATATPKGGPTLINGILVSSMKLRPNAEIYGKAVTRITADISVLLQKAGYSAEELTEYNFVRLTEGVRRPSGFKQRRACRNLFLTFFAFRQRHETSLHRKRQLLFVF